MKISKEFILLLVLSVLIIFNLFNTNNIKADITKYDDKINKIQTNIDSISLINFVIKTEIDNLNKGVDSIAIEIVKVDKKINIIRKNTDEKINSVDTFGINQLELFFTNRYGK
jgi:cell division protein FtsB